MNLKLIILVFGIWVLGAPAFAQETMTVKVFFHNEKLNPNMQDCQKVFPTSRTIPKTKAVARAALDELFKGTTEKERKEEFGSLPSEETKDIIANLNVKNGNAYLNFKKAVYEKLGSATTSCGSGFFSSVEATLKQFPTIKNVYYAVEGDADGFYEWVQVGECPHGKHCAKKNFQ
jgi:spore germination protein GerM